MSALLHDAITAINREARKADRGGRREERRARFDELIASLPSLANASDPDAKGFAPWSRKEIFEYRYARRARILATRPRMLRAIERDARDHERKALADTRQKTMKRVPFAKLTFGKRKALRKRGLNGVAVWVTK